MFTATADRAGKSSLRHEEVACMGMRRGDMPIQFQNRINCIVHVLMSVLIVIIQTLRADTRCYVAAVIPDNDT